MSDETRIWAVFRDARSAAAVVERWPDAELFASEPLETLAGHHAPVRTRLGYIMALAGLLGGVLGGSLAAGTGIWMGLDVGGLPRVPYAPIGIVTFAITALGAIAGGLVTLLVQGRIFGLRLAMPQAMRDAVAGGAVAAMLRARPEERAELTRELLAAGAESVEAIEP